jgi:hypothetical protein
MSARRAVMLAVALVSLIACSASAQHIAPSALLTIDQNRATVVDRIVNQWGDRLVRSNAGINAVQLREILAGLRADHLLAASLAGSVEGLRDVVSGALVRTDAVVSPSLMHAKSLGDTRDDLVYTPVVPCRILDTRNGTMPPYNAPMMGGSAFPVSAGLSSFDSQGGSFWNGNCHLPSQGGFAAIAVTLTVLNPNFDAFLAASNSSDFPTLTQAIVMDFSAHRGLANTAIVPLDAMEKFYLGLPEGVTTDVVADVVGYFRQPSNYEDNTISGSLATVGGGFANTAAGQLATIGGGQGNFASGFFNTIAGGYGNTASGGYSTIGGGALNSVYDRSTVSGGEYNAAAAEGSTVAGGGHNTASGAYSTVAGGLKNTASGTSSFAAGFVADANFGGCFVWSDGTIDNPTRCDGPNRFVARAEGGVYFYAGNDGTNAQGHYTGVALLPGAQAWTAASDRAGKDNLRPIDPTDVLRKVAAMPIATWNWRSQDVSVRHMGPMAQDFHAAFGLGETPKGISTIDADGVALAAIQGLHRQLKQKTREIARLTAKVGELDILKRKLEAIEAKLGLK